MTRYRKISSLIWNDSKFGSLSDDGQLLFFMFLTHPHMTSLGAMRTTMHGIAAEKRWAFERVSKGFRELSQKDMIQFDETACCLVLPNFIKHNPPENPNVVKSWSKAAEMIPECSLKNKLLQGLNRYIAGLPEPFQKAFGTLSEPFRNGMANQEQEQEQEQEYKKEILRISSPTRQIAESEKTEWPASDQWLKHFVTQQTVAPSPFLLDLPWWNAVSLTCGGIDHDFLQKEFSRMTAWFNEQPSRKPASRPGWKRFIRGWLERAHERERKYANGQPATR